MRNLFQGIVWRTVLYWL